MPIGSEKPVAPKKLIGFLKFGLPTVPFRLAAGALVGKDLSQEKLY